MVLRKGEGLNCHENYVTMKKQCYTGHNHFLSLLFFDSRLNMNLVLFLSENRGICPYEKHICTDISWHSSIEQNTF